MLLLHQETYAMFERARRGEMCVKKAVGLAVVNSRIFLRAACRVSLSPQGAVLSRILRVGFFCTTRAFPSVNSLWRVLQKSALIMHEITASKIVYVSWWSNNIALYSLFKPVKKFLNSSHKCNNS